MCELVNQVMIPSWVLSWLPCELYRWSATTGCDRSGRLALRLEMLVCDEAVSVLDSVLV